MNPFLLALLLRLVGVLVLAAAAHAVLGVPAGAVVVGVWLVVEGVWLDREATG